MPSPTLQWLSLVGVIWLQSINGTNTNFPAYSSQLKLLLSLSQLQLNNLAFASDAGKLFGLISGVASVYLPLYLVLMIGSLLGLTGYGLQYLFLASQTSSLSFCHVFFLSILAGNSICWINTVCYVVTIQNFPSYHQVAVGLSTSYVGLSAKIYTDIVDAFVPSSPIKRAKAYLLLNSILPLLVCIISAPIVRIIDVGKPSRMDGGFIVMFAITVATGIFSVISSFRSASTMGSLIGIGTFLLAPLMVPLAEQTRDAFKLRWRTNREGRVYDFTIDEKNVAESVEDGKEQNEKIAEAQEIHVKEEIGVKLMLGRIDFWLYFFVYISGATLGLVFLNNLGQIAESRQCSRISSLVSLSSSFSFFGRLLPSLLDYFLSRSKHLMSRPASVVLLLMAPLSGAFFLLVNGANFSLYLGTAIIGVCTGAITSIAVSMTTELFGTKNFGKNHNVVVANIPLGSFVFGYTAALLYRREGNGEGRCLGIECYKKTFITWGSLCVLGTFFAFVLHNSKVLCPKTSQQQQILTGNLLLTVDEAHTREILAQSQLITH
ncbi:LOW QUALITY PROTEIN: Nodulin-like [Dillenia turbinata]|uniref:Nodulin-like n=1 Tax=Dillenia turbinata TaxID=194707 RepID=A0AAN8VTX4_9MAGN